MKSLPLPLALLLLLAVAVSAQDSNGVYGVVRTGTPDGAFGEPVAGAVVAAIDESGKVAARAITASNGAYRLVVPPGDYRLVAEHPSFEPFDTGEAVLLVQERHFTLFNIGMAPAAAPGIAGRVLSPNGEPAVGAEAVVTDAAGEEVARFAAGAEGRFSGELPPGEYLVGAQCEGFESGEAVPVTVAEGIAAEATLRLAGPEPRGGFQGLIRARAEGGAAGRPIQGAEVTATNEGGTASRSATSNEIGFYRLLVAPGRWHLSASHPDFEPADSGPPGLEAEAEGMRTWNTLLRPLVPISGIGTCRRQFPIGIGSSYGERHIVYLRVRHPGTVTAVFRWSGDAAGLALIVRGPDGVPLRVDGRSPLRLTIQVRQEQIARGFQWEIGVANFGGGSAQGTLSVSFPCER